MEHPPNVATRPAPGNGASARTVRLVLAVVAGILLLAVLLVAGVVVFLTPVSVTMARLSSAEVVEFDEGLVYLVTDDSAIRIQQPRASDFAELEEQGARLGGEIDHVVIADEPTDSVFIMVPPDGELARLHLFVDGVLYPIVVRSGDISEIAGHEEAPVELLQRLTTARLGPA